MHNSSTVNMKRKLRIQGKLDNATKYVIGRKVAVIEIKKKLL